MTPKETHTFDDTKTVATRMLAHTPSPMRRFIKPHVSIQGLENQRNAQLLALLQLVIIIIGGLGYATLTIMFPSTADDPDTIVIGFGILLVAFGYWQTLRGKMQVGSSIMIAVSFILFSVLPFLPGAHPFLAAFAIVPVLLIGIFYSFKRAVQLALLIFIITSSLTVLVDSSFDRIFVQIFQALSFGLILTFMRHLAIIERIRRLRLETANAKLHESEMKLEQRVEERTRELSNANDELKIAWEKAKEADQFKSQFLASMSHELRTPLNAILNFTEFVSMGMLGPVTDKQVEALSKSLESGRHLLSLINDVLDIAKVETGMMQLFIEEDINIHAELETVLASIETLLKDKSVTFEVKIADNLPLMIGDRRRIRQIFLNLLSNAAKFTEQGQVKLNIIQKHEQIEFSIEDTGPGIAPEDHEIVFHPFRQTETGIIHANGTGLGLPITKRLVEAHGGIISLESERGAGAIFTVLLPFNNPELVRNEQSVTFEEATS